jgi:hypothetical protein
VGFEHFGDKRHRTFPIEIRPASQAMVISIGLFRFDAAVADAG